ncbi:hypothetical protein K502DRAFT_298660 [Neoconidiobolus thromboides FSU 785]|nr:hypothetical protein K502DRAFT_298660 [Neoconidiobolus thromboides FSU 785]
MNQAKLMHGIVKSVVSGDTVILRGSPKNNQPPPERMLTLNFVTAPRLPNFKKGIEEERYSFESRNFLRKLVAGKSVQFKVTFVSTGGREYGSIFLGDEDISIKMVEFGWCYIKENTKFNEEDTKLMEILTSKQQNAKDQQLGKWNTEGKSVTVNTNFPEDSRVLLNKFKGKKLKAFIEQTFDATLLKLYVTLPDEENSNEFIQQALLFQISGIKAPAIRKGTNGQPDTIEPFAEEAKFFIESRLLQKDIEVILEGLNNNTLCGTILHPAGNIAEALVSSGLAKVVDWTITMVTGGPSNLRKCEKLAKEKRLKLWKSHVINETSKKEGNNFEGIVSFIANGDSIHVISKDTNIEKKIQFSSIRAPKVKDSKEAGYAYQAKEYLRKLLIGKQVKVKIDYIKPASDGFEEKACASVQFNNKNLGVQLLEKGLAFIIRHKKEDDNRASNYDDLMVAEEKAKEAQIGVYSNKEPPTVRFTDASESLAKAKQFLSFFQRSGKISAVVEHIANASRFRLFVPSQNCKIAFILSGIKVPKVARNENEKSEPFGEEGLKFAQNLALQRDVELEIEGTDKNGAFIGSLFINKTNLAVRLLENGLATIFEVSADQSAYSNQLYAAETNARNKKLKIWTTIKEEDYEEEDDDIEKLKSQKIERVKLVVSEIVDGNKFYVQIVNQEIELLEKMMAEFSIHHSTPISNNNFSPKVNLICSAKFSLDNQWYRAKVKRISGGKAEVLYIDYGNSELVPLSNLRPIPDKFTKLKSQAIEAKLAYLKVPTLDKDYGNEALNVFRELVEGKQLNATIEARTSGVTHLCLYMGDHYNFPKSINAEMLRSGYAIIEKKEKLPMNLRVRENEIGFLNNIQEHVKKERLGMWEFGEVADDDE